MSNVTRTDHGRVLELQRYVETLLGACVDYRNLLVRANVPDPVSGRQEGVEEVCRRYGVKLTRRSLYGERTWQATTEESE